LAYYGEFEAAHFTVIVAWRNYYVPDYADVFGGAPRVVYPSSTSRDKEKKEEGKSEEEEQKPRDVVNPPPFNPTSQFFMQLGRDYQGQHWYSILDKELKTLVRNEALRLDEPPTLRFFFETSKRIEINLLEEKAAMGFLKREEKLQEQVKAASQGQFTFSCC
jgi:hypothetical protein